MDTRLADTTQIRTTNSVSRTKPFRCSMRFDSIKILFKTQWISRADLDCLLSLNDKDVANTEIVLKPSVDVYHATSRFLSLFKEKSTAYSERLEHLCRYLLASLESENPKLSYIGVALNKDLSIAWIRHIKLLLYRCCTCMEKLKPGKCCAPTAVACVICISSTNINLSLVFFSSQTRIQIVWHWPCICIHWFRLHHQIHGPF